MRRAPQSKEFPLTALSKTATRLAAGMAHQLNNVLTIIGGHASVLTEDLSAGHSARPSAEAISEASAAAAELTNQLLSYAGQLRQEPQECVVEDLMAAVELGGEAPAPADRGDSRGTPAFTWEPHLPHVLVDPIRFREVLGHLAAFGRSMARGSGEMAVYAALAPTSAVGGVHVSVQVTISGPELRPIETRGLFEPFVASEHGEAADGMRLAAAWGIVERWGGNLTAEADATELKFSFLLPAIA